jgi:hypothetical protein
MHFGSCVNDNSHYLEHTWASTLSFASWLSAGSEAGACRIPRVIKTLLYLGALATFIWLVTHNQSFAEVCIAIVGAAFKILLSLIGALTLIIIVAIICVLIMFIISTPPPNRLVNVLSSEQV